MRPMKSNALLSTLFCAGVLALFAFSSPAQAWPWNPPLILLPPPPPPVYAPPYIPPGGTIILNTCALYTETHGGTHDFNFGNSHAGVSGEITAMTYSREQCYDGSTTRPDAAKYDLHLDANLRIFGSTINALYAGIESENVGGQADTLVLFKLGNYTVYSEDDPTLTLFDDSETITLIQTSHTFIVATIPVTVSASVGVGFEGQAAVTANMPVAATASLGGWIQGNASVGVGTYCFRLGLDSDLRLFNTQIEAGVQVFPDGATGFVDLEFEAVRILLKACAEALCAEYCLPIVNFSLGRIQASLLSI